MTSALEVWANKVLNVIDADTTRRTGRVVLQVEGATWETWTPPFPSPEEWARTAEEILAQIKEESPPRKLAAQFVAEDESGAVRSTLPRTILGSNKNAADTQSGPKALAESMQAQASTMKAILDSARVQAETQTKVMQGQAELIAIQNELLQAKAEEKILEKEKAAGEQTVPVIQQFIAQHAGQLMPRLMALADLLIETKGGGGSFAKVIREATQENNEGVPS